MLNRPRVPGRGALLPTTSSVGSSFMSLKQSVSTVAVAACAVWALCARQGDAQAQRRAQDTSQKRLAPKDLARLNRVRRLLQSAQGKMTFRRDPDGAKADLHRAARILDSISATAGVGANHPDIRPVAARLETLRRQADRLRATSAGSDGTPPLDRDQQTRLRRVRKLLQQAYSKMQLVRDYTGAREDVELAHGLIGRVMKEARLSRRDARVADHLRRIAAYRKDLDAKLGVRASKPQKPRRRRVTPSKPAKTRATPTTQTRRRTPTPTVTTRPTTQAKRVRRRHVPATRPASAGVRARAERARSRAARSRASRRPRPRPPTTRPTRATTAHTQPTVPAPPNDDTVAPRSLAHAGEGQWVRYRVTGGPMEQKQTVLAVSNDAVVVRMETVLDGRVINTIDEKIALTQRGRPVVYMAKGKPLRMETLVVAGRRLTCLVWELDDGPRGRTRIWTCPDVPLLGLVRSVKVRGDTTQVEMELIGFGQGAQLR